MVFILLLLRYWSQQLAVSENARMYLLTMDILLLTGWWKDQSRTATAASIMGYLSHLEDGYWLRKTWTSPVVRGNCWRSHYKKGNKKMKIDCLTIYNFMIWYIFYNINLYIAYYYFLIIVKLIIFTSCPVKNITSI